MSKKRGSGKNRGKRKFSVMLCRDDIFYTPYTYYCIDEIELDKLLKYEIMRLHTGHVRCVDHIGGIPMLFNEFKKRFTYTYEEKQL